MASPTAALSAEQLQILLNGPAGLPPAGVMLELENSTNLNAFLILTLTVALTFGTLAVSLRMYTKLYIIRSIAYEDYVVILGWLIHIAATVPSTIFIRHSGGYHMWNLKLRTFFDMLYWANLSVILYCPVVFFIKLSILLQYLRIFVPNRNGNMFTFVAIHVCIWSCFVIYIVAFSLAIVQCTPRQKIWNPLTTRGHCIKSSVVVLLLTTFNITSDFAILILPMPSLWRLQMPLRRKISATTIFATGFLACVISILRTYYAWQIVNSRDASYNLVKIYLWTHAEIAIGVLVSCMPVLPSFFQHFGSKIYATFAYKSKLGRSDNNLGQAKSQPPVLMAKLQNSTKSSPSSPSERHFFRRSSIGGGGTNSASETWNEAHQPSTAEAKSEYAMLDEYEAVLLREVTASGMVPQIAQGGIATKRDELESGPA